MFRANIGTGGTTLTLQFINRKVFYGLKPAYFGTSTALTALVPVHYSSFGTIVIPAPKFLEVEQQMQVGSFNITVGHHLITGQFNKGCTNTGFPRPALAANYSNLIH
jgi:hypothetical protein